MATRFSQLWRWDETLSRQYALHNDSNGVGLRAEWECVRVR